MGKHPTYPAFRTDTEISKSAFDPTAGGRTLQKWSDDPGLSPLDTDNPGGLPAWAAPSGNSAADGGLTASEPAAGGWDQFAANEAKFGIKSDYEETLYTTKLDRSGKDFKERERKAERLAREIMGVSVLYDSAGGPTRIARRPMKLQNSPHGTLRVVHLI